MSSRYIHTDVAFADEEIYLNCQRAFTHLLWNPFEISKEFQTNPLKLLWHSKCISSHPFDTPSKFQMIFKYIIRFISMRQMVLEEMNYCRTSTSTQPKQIKQNKWHQLCAALKANAFCRVRQSAHYCSMAVVLLRGGLSSSSSLGDLLGRPVCDCWRKKGSACMRQGPLIV